MIEKQLKQFFTSVEDVETEEPEEKEVFLHFKYNGKYYYTAIDTIKEILDLPLYIPFPTPTKKFLGVINLRGTVIPIFDPFEELIKKQSELKFKAYEQFRKLKLRLIVFELKDNECLALPVTEVGKFEIEKDQISQDKNFIEIGKRAYEQMSIETMLEGLK